MKNDKDKQRGEVSRRDFLVVAGAVVVGGAIGAGITYPLLAGKEPEVITTTKTVSVPTTVTSTVAGPTVTMTAGATTVTSTVPGPTKTITTTVGAVVEPVEPGYAPGEQVVKTYCRVCSTSCGANAYVKDGRLLRVEGMPEHPVGNGGLCGKGLAAKQWVYSSQRLKYPLKRVGERGEGKWQRITWDEALDTIATKFKETTANYGAEAIWMVGGATGGQPFRDVGWCRIRLANALGTPNTGLGGNLCHTPRVEAQGMTLGDWPKADYQNTKCMLSWGENKPWSGVPLAVPWLDAKERGAKLIVVDPIFTPTAAKADIWLPVRPGSDGALALGMMNVIINENLYDHDFVANWTVGFDDLKEYVQAFTPKKVAEITWVAEDKIIEVARAIATIKPTCFAIGDGLDQGTNVMQAIRAVCLLEALTGNLDIPGGNVFKLEAEAPALKSLDGADLLSAEQKAKMLGRVGAFPRVTNYALNEAIFTGKPYQLRVGWMQGGSAFVSHANSKQVREAFLKLEFLVSVDLVMTPVGEIADIVLPAASTYESECLKAWSPGLLQLRPVVVSPIGESRPDVDIVFELAKKLGLGDKFWDGDVEKSWNFQLEPTGFTMDDLRKKPEGIWIDIPFEVKYKKYEKDGFNTPSKKVEFACSKLEKAGIAPLPEYIEHIETPYSEPELAKKYPLVLNSGRYGLYCQGQMRDLPWLREIETQPTVEINPVKAKELGIADGEWVIVENWRGSVKKLAHYFEGINPGVVLCRMGWWQSCEELNLPGYGWDGVNQNILYSNYPVDPIYNNESLRATLCNVRKAVEV